MKKLLFATAIMFAATTTFAQDGDVAFTKGSSSISLGYGFLSPYKSLFKISNLFGTGAGVSAKYSAIGPVAVTYEYGATEKLGVGLQVGYASNKNVTTTKDGISAGKDYIVTEKLDQISAIARVNYHFGNSSKFDPYAGLGLGYGNFTYKTTTNDPTDTPADLALFKISVPGAFGITGQLGAKYYFSPNFGAYAEVGYLAGSFAQLGITAKF
jgi:outer membrane protein W